MAVIPKKVKAHLRRKRLLGWEEAGRNHEGGWRLSLEDTDKQVYLPPIVIVFN